MESSTQVSRAEGARFYYPRGFEEYQVEKTSGSLPLAVKACSDSLRPALEKVISFFPELLRVMHETVGQPIQIFLVNGNFKARWDHAEKEILIGEEHFNQNRCYGPILDILFEMQNACYTQLLKDAKRKAPQLSVERYVRKVEMIEWSTCSLTCARLESLPERDFPSEENDFLYTYFEDRELYYLHQQVSGHSFAIATRYQMIPGTRDKTPFTGTWKVPFGKDDFLRKALFELLTLHLKTIRTGKGQRVLREKIAIVEAHAMSGTDWAVKTLINLHFFSEKFEASTRFSNTKVPLYKPNSDKLKLLGIVD